ncbi:MAG: 50S ribosomal protein L11 methyltransferase [Spongiibacteraceae bacterium]|nr:50S ribosomal protein L11 methyltransferase [Spongiibacteraceae bacterium]
MPWLQLRIETQREHSNALEEALLSAGAASVTIQDNADQPILEPAVGETPLWQQVQITGLFDAEIDTSQTTVIVIAAFGNSLPTYRWELLEDKDWERAWMDNFHPMCFGKRLWICPSWKQPPEPTAVNLMLDPGLAFGTGTHPTTALCLQWLDAINFDGKTVIDYGCGSGILGIAALLLGAAEVFAIDNDPQALTATLSNAERNNIDTSRIHTYLPGQLPNKTKADFVIANILAGPLIELAPLISELTQTGGQLVLSGIIKSQSDTLIKHYSPFFKMDDPAEQEDWLRLTGIKF